MHSLYLSSLLKQANIKPERVKLIRHVFSHQNFQLAYDNNAVLLYTQVQAERFYDNIDYVLVFIAGNGTTAKFYGGYKVLNESRQIDEELLTSNLPSGFIEYLETTDNIFHELEEANLFKDLENRLYIEWGKGPINWQQRGTNDKPIIQISEIPKYTFSGYENVILNYDELGSIVDDPLRYSDWHTALKSVQAVYLITVLETGEQYIGATYGDDGLLHRWKTYYKTKHGGNVGLKSVLKENPDVYKQFQFSILQIVSKHMTQKDIVELEELYKHKLGNREINNKYSLNKN